MLDIKATTTKYEQGIISNTSPWRECMNVLINHYTTIGKPFTSGEIAAKMRTFRPSFSFSAFTVGTEVREMFLQGKLGLDRFSQFERFTPSGQLIFVYAPNKWSGETYDFEVKIPKPQHTDIDSFSIDFEDEEDDKQVNLTNSPQLWELTVSDDGRLKLRKGLVELLLEKQGNKDHLKFSRISSKSGLGISFSTKGIETCKVEKDGRARISGFKHFMPGTTFMVSLSELI